MHSTAEDLAILLRCMLNGGSCETALPLTRSAFDPSAKAMSPASDHGRTVWSPAAVEAMTTNQNAASVPGAPWGLGWGLKDSLVWNFFGQLCSKRTFVSYQPDVSCACWTLVDWLDSRLDEGDLRVLF